MTSPDKIRTLLTRLELLETYHPRPEERPILEVARRALLDEIQRTAAGDGLQIYRRGGTLGAITDAG